MDKALRAKRRNFREAWTDTRRVTKKTHRNLRACVRACESTNLELPLLPVLVHFDPERSLNFGHFGKVALDAGHLAEYSPTQRERYTRHMHARALSRKGPACIMSNNIGTTSFLYTWNSAYMHA